MALPGLVAANNLSDVADRERAWDNLGSSLATGDITIPAPSLDLNFAANKSLVDDISGNNLITFSRASSGTFVGSNGLIQTAASGVPRFDHNPVTGESLGLLVEEARTNSLWPSEPTSATARNTVGGPGNAWFVYDGTTASSSKNGITGLEVTINSALDSNGYDGASFGGIGGGGFFFPSTTASLSFFIHPLTWTGNIAVKKLPTGGESVFGGFTTLFNGGIYTGPTDYIKAIFPDGTYWLHNILWTSLSTNFGSAHFTAIITTTPGDNIKKFWTGGFQFEAGSFSTSYIPTVASTVTRAADVASITGANFSGWYNNNAGTTFFDARVKTPAGFVSHGFLSQESAGHYRCGILSNNWYAWTTGGAIGDVGSGGAVVNGRNKGTFAYDKSIPILTNSFNGNAIGSLAGRVPVSPTSVPLVYAPGSVQISRLVYWPYRLNNKALRHITQPSTSSVNVYSFSFAIKGRDVLALEDARNTSTRDFIFIKGLLSAAQPRLTAAAASTSSGLTLATDALPKLSPTSSGNYLFASGLTLSGVTTRINGTNALSIATSPFSGSTATAPLLFRELRPQANWRITEPMPSGTIASPELAIPFETNDFVLFMKAGQN